MLDAPSNNHPGEEPMDGALEKRNETSLHGGESYLVESHKTCVDFRSRPATALGQSVDALVVAKLSQVANDMMDRKWKTK